MNNLTSVKQGKRAMVTGLKEEERFISRTTAIGITIGGKLEVIRNEKKRPMLLYCRDTIIAMNRNECEKIEVEEIEG